MNKLSKVLIVVIIALVMLLGLMLYNCAYWRNGYINAANEMIRIAERLEKIDNVENRNDENVSIKINENTKEGATIVVEDKNKVPHIWLEEYKIRVKVNDEWQDLEEKETQGENSQNVIGLDENGILEQKLNWESRYGSLENGIYKIVKHAITPAQDIYFDTEEFEIK